MMSWPYEPHRWWITPLLVFIFGTIAIVYLTWAAWQGTNYHFGPYTSPVYATPYVPSWWPFSPAFLLLWIPIGFRLTCYYGRKAYYRTAFLDPIACGIEEPYRKKYSGETSFPFILQNLHRYFLYFALILLAIHWYDLVVSLFYNAKIYIGLGTLILLFDTIAVSFYVFGCHSLKHLVGGQKRAISCDGCGCASYQAWRGVSFLNQFHNFWFWVSLYSIIVADLYIRLLASQTLPFDPHLSL